MTDNRRVFTMTFHVLIVFLVGGISCSSSKCIPGLTDCIDVDNSDWPVSSAILQSESIFNKDVPEMTASPHGGRSAVLSDPGERRSSSEKFQDFDVLHVINEDNRDIPSMSMLHAEQAPSPRSLSLHLLQKESVVNLANSIHNTSHYTSDNKKRGLPELSDVSLEDVDHEQDSAPRLSTKQMFHPKAASKQDHSGVYLPENPTRITPKLGNSVMLQVLCDADGLVFKVGDIFEKGCSERCTCTKYGNFTCAPRCSLPFHRRGARFLDPQCSEKPATDPCCALMICESDFNGEDSTNVEHKGCFYKNMSYAHGAKFHVGCEETCVCQLSGVVACNPRCSEHTPKSHCVLVPDPQDSCCRLELCDVAAEDGDVDIDKIKGNSGFLPDSTSSIATNTVDRKGIEIKQTPGDTSIISVSLLPNRTIQVNVGDKDIIKLEMSNDGGYTWTPVGNQLENIEPNRRYLLRTEAGEKPFVFSVPDSTANDSNSTVVHHDGDHYKYTTSQAEGCDYDGKHYKVGEEYHKGCAELCLCITDKLVECAPLLCPSTDQLDVLHPGCIKWRPKPANFESVPPKCCPPEMECISNGSCTYKEQNIPNWTEVPTSLTGCERRCFCESGDIDCQDICLPLPPQPPKSLHCPPKLPPVPKHPIGDDCCFEWSCSDPSDANIDNGIPNNETMKISKKNNIPINDIVAVFGTPPPTPILRPDIPAAGLNVVTLESDTPTSLRLVLTLPSGLVGLQGRVEVQYIKANLSERSQWSSRIFTPTGGILNTTRLELRLTNLEPDSEYKIRSSVLPPLPPLTSDVRSVKTKAERNTTMVHKEKNDFEIKEVDASLRVSDVNSSFIQLEWRRFTNDELVFIDGVQIRYRQSDSPIFMTTSLLHRMTDSYLIGGLKSNISYVCGLLLIPPVGATVELRVPTLLNIKTPPYIDIYNFSVSMETSDVTMNSVQLKWSGIPGPEARFVTVYRGVCQADIAHTMTSSNQPSDVVVFKLTATARMEEPAMKIIGLYPGTRYRVWLELYLTNGRMKTSNVVDIVTNPATHKEEETDMANEIPHGERKLAKPSDEDHYYGALVGTAVIAVLAGMTALLLLLALLRRHRPHTATITALGHHNGTSRVIPGAPAQSAMPPYDTPTFKLELQQETMNL